MISPNNDLYKRITRYLSRILKRSEDVEEIAQESFLKVLEAGSKGEIRYPQAYLYRTARNLAFNRLSHKSNKLVDSLEDILGADVLLKSNLLEDDLMAQERFELFCRASTNLPEVTRKVLILRKVYGLSRKEVAIELNISISAVEKHLAKALERCIHYLEVSGYSMEVVKQVRKKP